MLFGVAAVNKYYDYYQPGVRWPPTSAPRASIVRRYRAAPPGSSREDPGNRHRKRAAAQQGETVRLVVSGRLSHIKRTVLSTCRAVLPGRLRHRRLPAIELITDSRAAAGLDQRGGHHPDYLTCCTNKVSSRHPGHARRERRSRSPSSASTCGTARRRHLPAVDLPTALRTRSGSCRRAGLGITGYSEGGYCAANLALSTRPDTVLRALSGYFAPLPDDQLGLRCTRSARSAKTSEPRTNTPSNGSSRCRSARRSPVLARRRSSWHTDVKRPWPSSSSCCPAAQRVLDIEPGGSHNMAPGGPWCPRCWNG